MLNVGVGGVPFAPSFLMLDARLPRLPRLLRRRGRRRYSLGFLGYFDGEDAVATP